MPEDHGHRRHAFLAKVVSGVADPLCLPRASEKPRLKLKRSLGGLAGVIRCTNTCLVDSAWREGRAIVAHRHLVCASPGPAVDLERYLTQARALPVALEGKGEARARLVRHATGLKALAGKTP